MPDCTTIPTPTATAPRAARLTPEQRAVAVLAARGLENKRIADELGVPESVVKRDLHGAMRRLGVGRRTALVAVLGAPGPGAAPGDATARIGGRQEQVCALVAEGLSNKEVAHALDISAATVKLHLKSLMTRVRVGNRTELAAWWLARPRAG
jgi:DNA-binding NarL/FixJ family response regulator